MRRACELALAHGVSVGAHPSYPDRDGFGRRRPSHLNPAALLDEICRQVEAFEAVARSVGLAPQHFKPHGQLYNDAAVDEALALLLIDVARHFPHLALLALAASPQVSLSRSAGITVLEEAFPDRAYTPMGTLVPRSQTGALIDNVDVLTRQSKTSAMLYRMRGMANLGLADAESVHLGSVDIHVGIGVAKLQHVAGGA